ncbi:glycosyltransferase family 4 protein [Bacillus carboniphilus]|uniref:Glycosyltransferase family 4 protein n=1 Tax=Bacillus carboniphilus TaxID=86663 RepID=A0ABY9JY50_9BACI|nr:glycosyltransferase family 4 protein [Bacillus carboniphilus]WLR44322.1 glycosyltransferase family 4 protein [Bacillus carboniphilus]
MMKILVLANFGMGLYNFRKELLEKLIEQNHEVFISLPNDEEYVPKLERMGCNFINTPISRRGTNPITDFKLLLNYKKVIRSIKPDLVLTYTIKPNIYGGLACRLANVSYLVNITGLGTAVENGGILQKVTLLLYKTALKKAKCVFFQNESNMNFLTKKKVIKGKYKVLPGSGVNLSHYALFDYPSDNTTINFLFISRVMKEKGIDQYLDAAGYIKKRYPNTAFHIIGFCEDVYEEKLFELQEKGIIIYHGKQSDIRTFHKISHCTIHPTYYPEGMSNVLLESAACGRPIITTDRSGCKEIVYDGINGFIIKEKDTQGLIDKIGYFLTLTNEQKVKMGLAGRRKVEKSFDRQIVVDAYIEEINNG